jgi:Protein of unknown function (DUF3237)
MAKLAAGNKVDPDQYYFRAAPRFAAARGKYDWLNGNMFVCAGARYPEFVELSFYQLASAAVIQFTLRIRRRC